MGEKTKVSACIVTYNGFETAAAAARSILQQTQSADLTLYLVDNASPDGCGQRLAETFAGEPRVRVILLPKNVGFGAGHNAVIGQLGSDYHAVINPDVLLREDAISRICAYLDSEPSVVMATPRLVWPDGRAQYTPKRRPTAMALLSRRLSWPVLRRYERHYLMLDRDLSQTQDIEFCAGCFFLVRTQAFRRAGGFDPDYFMYVEDADLTQKMLRLGRVVYWPGTSVVHAWNRAPSRDGSSARQQLRSMNRFFRKWGFRWGFSICPGRPEDHNQK